MLSAGECECEDGLMRMSSVRQALASAELRCVVDPCNPVFVSLTINVPRTLCLARPLCSGRDLEFKRCYSLTYTSLKYALISTMYVLYSISLVAIVLGTGKSPRSCSPNTFLTICSSLPDKTPLDALPPQSRPRYSLLRPPDHLHGRRRIRLHIERFRPLWQCHGRRFAPGLRSEREA